MVSDLVNGFLLGVITTSFGYALIWKFFMQRTIESMFSVRLKQFVDNAALEVMKECSCGGDCKCEGKK